MCCRRQDTRRSLTPIGLLEFIAKMRELSGGKPVGFKLCVGKRREFLAVCKAMVKTGITPDFITIDGGEGGTGAAPLEFSNHVGMPLLDALAVADNALPVSAFGMNGIYCLSKIMTRSRQLRWVPIP